MLSTVLFHVLSAWDYQLQCLEHHCDHQHCHHLNGILEKAWFQSLLFSPSAWLTWDLSPDSLSMKSIISVTFSKQTFLSIATTQPARILIGISVLFKMQHAVDCEDTTDIGISNPAAKLVNDETCSTSIHVVSTDLVKQTGISLDVYASIICACFDFTRVDLCGGGIKS